MQDPAAELSTHSRVERPASAPLTRGMKYVPSPSPVDPFIVISKQFDFTTSTLSQIGTAVRSTEGHSSQAPPPPPPPTVTISRLPTNYTLAAGPIRAVSHGGGKDTTTAAATGGPHLHRGSSNIQSSFFEKLTKKNRCSIAATASSSKQRGRSTNGHAKSSPSSSATHSPYVSKPISRDESLTPRRRPSDQQRCGHFAAKPIAATIQWRCRQNAGFDSRMAVVKAAQSACLSSAPLVGSSASARKDFYDLESASRQAPPSSATTTGSHDAADASVDAVNDEASLMLRHRRTELMLAAEPAVAGASAVDSTAPPLLGAGMRALLLASQDNVQSVATGVLIVAQVLGEDIHAQHQRQQQHQPPGGSHSEHLVPTANQPFYKDAGNPSHGGGGESWRIIYAAGQAQPSAHGLSSPQRSAAAAAALAGKPYAQLFNDQHHHQDRSRQLDFSADGSSLMPDGDILNGSAVRIRGRPHTAPLTRGGGRDENTKPIDYLAEMRAERPTSAAAKGRPSSAAPPTIAVKHTNNAIPRPYSAASTRASNMYVLDPHRDASTKPSAPEWLDSRGLIGVSVDPRYNNNASNMQYHGREGFDVFGASVAPTLDGGGGEGGDHLKHHGNRFTHFRSGTALSVIREARVKRDAAALAHRKGILRGGAGFLMFSGAK
ncbi:Hypothetical protein, putative [Bodo saltans]|uniref:Uncharacterized protein n=1 Tax=Bodo saltans TaxID=75058 RepID=A0A0S4JFZ4_BODSA|nr:Hypothetical protein, putative [Bodo saltans]|eukprot:CUG90408.1 Hypothetical protein, putative [Bodo saltans]